MGVTSFAGTVLILYSTLWLLDGRGKLDAADWSAKRQVLLNWTCAGIALLGFLVQFLLERRLRKLAAQGEDDKNSLAKQWWRFWDDGKRTRKRAA
jgi:hypothetical protein